MTLLGRRLLAIQNPRSGGGGYKRDLPLIMGALRGLGYEVDERATQGEGDGARLARAAFTAWRRRVLRAAQQARVAVAADEYRLAERAARSSLSTSARADSSCSQRFMLRVPQIS